jgi:hypothetical protein
MNAEGIAEGIMYICCVIFTGIIPAGYYLLWRDQHRSRRANETRRREAEHAARMAEEECQRAKQHAEEEERQREERRKAHTARAVAAFPGYWTEYRILNRPGWKSPNLPSWKSPPILNDWESPKIADLFPPDVIVECGDEDIEFYKATRVRELEANYPGLREVRRWMADEIRRERLEWRLALEHEESEREHEEYLRERLAEQIRVNIHDLPPIGGD